MSSSVPVQQGGVVVVTQMYSTPAQGGVVCNQIPRQMCTGKSAFLRAHPLALGTVQIMIGVVVFLFGVVTAVTSYRSLTVYSGFFVWGAGFYITAGSLTVAAGKSSNRCLMNATLAFNVIATVAACAAVILYALDATVTMDCYYYGYGCNRYQQSGQGMIALLAVFHFLEFIITIVVSAFVCQSTCNCCNEQQPSVYVVPGNASMAPQAQPSYSHAPATVVQLPSQMMNVSNPANGQSFPGLADPPGYSEEIKSF